MSTHEEDLRDTVDRLSTRVENLITQVNVFTRKRDTALKAAEERIIALEARVSTLELSAKGWAK